MLRSFLMVGTGLVVVAALGGCHRKSASAWKLPVDAKQLPGTTSSLEAQVIEGTTETNEHSKKMFTAAELGSAICKKHADDPARDLALMNKAGPEAAREFFTPAHITDVQSTLECGEVLQANLSGNFLTALEFTDDSSQKQDAGILQLKSTEIPSKFGFSKHAFSGMNGFCRTTDVSKPNAPTTECGPTTDSALASNGQWFFGARSALETIAHSISNPKAEMTTQVTALNDAANEVEGLASSKISANVTTVKPFLMAPCAFGAEQSAGSALEFISGCFPSTADKTIQDMDAKVRAAAFEIEPDILKSGAVHGNVLLIGRDDDAAKTIEKDAADLVTDWKSQLENNEAKLIKQAKDDPSSRKEKRWVSEVATFTKALEGTKVTRSGRTVKLSFNQALSDDDKKDLADANAKSEAKHAAIADLLDAIASKKPLPADAMAKVVGPVWAPYLIQMATLDVKAMPVDCAKKREAAKKKGAPALDPKCVIPTEPSIADYGTHPATTVTTK